MRSRGRITVEYRCSCGRCDQENGLGTSRRPAVAARKQGWRLTKAFGWVCGRCADMLDHVAQFEKARA